MRTEMTVNSNWSPLRPLLFTGVWLVLVALLAFALGSGCTGGTAPPPVADGKFTLTWSITDQSGRPATCTDVNARSVALRLRDRATGNVLATAFPCEASPGTADAASGMYDISIELHAADGSRLADAPDQDGVRISAGQVTRLTPVAFRGSTLTTVVLSIATSTATNCRPTTAGGAGITGTTLTLERDHGGCVPVTFIRSLAGTERGTYTVACTSPQVAACIERTETLTTSLGPGTYTIHVRGKLGAIDCWQRDDNLVVPPPGKPLVRTLGLVHQSIPGC